MKHIHIAVSPFHITLGVVSFSSLPLHLHPLLASGLRQHYIKGVDME